jgi:hypothetical protein
MGLSLAVPEPNLGEGGDMALRHPELAQQAMAKLRHHRHDGEKSRRRAGLLLLLAHLAGWD